MCRIFGTGADELRPPRGLVQLQIFVRSGEITMIGQGRMVCRNAAGLEHALPLQNGLLGLVDMLDGRHREHVIHAVVRQAGVV